VVQHGSGKGELALVGQSGQGGAQQGASASPSAIRIC
jgi:hypothetical protein